MQAMLAIDDNADVREALEGAFGLATCADAMAGMKAIQGTKFAMVFCDIEGIQAGGLGIADVVKQCLSLGIPVICISGNPYLAEEIASTYGIAAIPKSDLPAYLERVMA